MRYRPLTYADAARLLGAAEDPVVKILGAVSGVGAAVLTLHSLGGRDIFALRGQLIEWGNAAVTGLRERMNGVHRFDRTQRLEAAHAIVVVTSFYEALEEVLSDRPEVDLAAARLTAGEQVAIATSTAAETRYADLVQVLIDTPPPMPAPHRPFEATIGDLADYYRSAAVALRHFLGGLSDFE